MDTQTKHTGMYTKLSMETNAPRSKHAHTHTICTQTHSYMNKHRHTEEPVSLLLPFPSPPTSYLLFLFPLTVHSLLTGRVGKVQAQSKGSEGETRVEVQSPRESYFSAKTKGGDG